MILKNYRDSLAKRTGQTGTRDPQPLDLDLADQIKVAYDLIWAATSESGGSGGKGVRAAARLAGGAFPWRRMTGESVLGAAGLRLGWGLAVEDARGTCSPLGVRAGFGEVRSTEFGGHGGSGRRGLAGAGGSVTPGGYGYQI